MIQQVKKLAQVALVSGAIRQSIVATLGSIIAGVVSAVAIILASRILGPENFGVFSVATSLIAVTSKIGDWGLNSVVTRLLPKWRDDQEKSQNLLGQLVQWKLVLTLVGALVLLIIGPQIREGLNFPYPLIWVGIIIGAAILVAYEYVYLILSALHDFLWLGYFSIAQAVLKVVLFGGLWLFSFHSALSVLVAYALAPAVSVLLVADRLHNWLFVRPKPVARDLQHRILRFASHASVGVVSMALISNLDLLLVQTHLTPFETGLYAGASRIALFVSLLTAAVGGVLNNRVVRYETRATQTEYLIKSLAVVGLAALGFVLFLPAAKLVIALTIGSEYLSGLPTLILLVGNAFLGLAIVPYISFFYAVNRPAYFSIGGVLQVALIFGGTILLLPQYGLAAAAYARLLATIAFALFTGFYLLRELRSPTQAQ